MDTWGGPAPRWSRRRGARLLLLLLTVRLGSGWVRWGPPHQPGPPASSGRLSALCASCPGLSAGDAGRAWGGGRKKGKCDAPGNFKKKKKKSRCCGDGSRGRLRGKPVPAKWNFCASRLLAERVGESRLSLVQGKARPSRQESGGAGSGGGPGLARQPRTPSWGGGEAAASARSSLQRRHLPAVPARPRSLAGGCWGRRLEFRWRAAAALLTSLEEPGPAAGGNARERLVVLVLFHCAARAAGGRLARHRLVPLHLSGMGLDPCVGWCRAAAQVLGVRNVHFRRVTKLIWRALKKQQFGTVV